MRTQVLSHRSINVSPRPCIGFAASLIGGLLLAACSSSAGRVSSQSGVTGQQLALPGGRTAFVDPNANGTTSSLQIAELLFVDGPKLGLSFGGRTCSEVSRLSGERRHHQFVVVVNVNDLAIGTP